MCLDLTIVDCYCGLLCSKPTQVRTIIITSAAGSVKYKKGAFDADGFPYSAVSGLISVRHMRVTSTDWCDRHLTQ